MHRKKLSRRVLFSMGIISYLTKYREGNIGEELPRGIVVGELSGELSGGNCRGGGETVGGGERSGGTVGGKLSGRIVAGGSYPEGNVGAVFMVMAWGELSNRGMSLSL